MNANVRTALRLLAALAVLASGLLHAKIWNSTYRGDKLLSSLPGAWVVKDGFPAQAAVCVVVALLLIFVRRPLVWVAAILVQLGSILALVLSRKASIFGWKEPIWSTDAKEVLVVEIAAVLILSALMVIDVRRLEAEDDLATY